MNPAELRETLLDKTGEVLLLSSDAAAPVVSVEDVLHAPGGGGGVSFLLRCSFEDGGPWAGVRDLYQALISDLKSKAPDLIERHDYELVHVLPELKEQLVVRNLNLTDIASADERVRSYPADRAMRIVHGLIDLLASFKERISPDPWLLLCLDFDCASHMGQAFFRELMRRRGAQLRLILLPVFSSPTAPRVAADFPVPSRVLPFAVARPTSPYHGLSPEEAARRAAVLEAEVSEDTLESTAKLPELIRLLATAGKKRKLLYWKAKALHAFNTLGLYQDAIRYGEATRDLFKTEPQRTDPTARWAIFFKLFMSYLGTGAIDSAFQLAEEDVLAEGETEADEAPMRVRLCYLMAMLHARFRPDRNFAVGEQYLERGLVFLENASLEKSEYWFHFVFNRNGLAMIRNFQGRFAEALELCNQGHNLLEAHLEPERHRLHRSVLLYNIAQIYAQIGADEQAVDSFGAAIRCDSNYSEYYNERGNLLLKLGKWSAAEQDYRKAIILSPPYPEVWFNLGQCLRLTHQMAEASEAYSRSLDLSPAQAGARLGRAQAWEALGRIEEAIEDYGGALELNPALWEARAGRAVLLYETGQLDQSLGDLDAAISLSPREGELYQNRAVVLTDLGRYEEAHSDLTHCLEFLQDAGDRAEVESRLEALDSLRVVPDRA